MKVLVTGGAGFVGSTVASACADAGIEPVVVDDLSTGSAEFGQRFAFYHGDFADPGLLRRVFADHPDLAAVVHCAARVDLPRSTRDPLDCYANNLAKVVRFLSHLDDTSCRRVVFSSTAAVYAPSRELVVTEASPVAPTSPYAASKLMVERVLQDVAAATDLRAVTLRYFNPVGADPALRTGPTLPVPSHVLGRLLRAHREGTPFTVTGTRWPTRDGSGLRDYVHVWDLARAHVAVLRGFDRVVAAGPVSRGYQLLNLGTGSGTTVLELVAAFERVTGAHVPVRGAPPRPGDTAGCCASAAKASAVLGWRPELTLAEGIADALAWDRTVHGAAEGVLTA